MPAWNNVALAPPVTSRDYNQGFQNFLQLGNQIAQLPTSYYAGQQMGRNTALQNAFSNGLPIDSQGNVDVNATLQTIGKLGGAQYVQQLLPFMMKQQMLQSLDQQPTGGPGGQGVSGTGPAHLGNTGTMTAGAVDQSTVPPGASAGDVSYGEGNNTSGSPAPTGGTSGGEGGGAVTYPGPQAGMPGGSPSEGGGGGYVSPSTPGSIAGQLTPGRDPLTEAKSLRLRAEGLRRQAQRLEIIQPNMGKAKLEQAKSLDEQASRYEDSIKTGAETQFKGGVERYGKQYENYNSQGIAADQLIDKVELGKNTANDPNFYSGAPAPEFVNRMKAVGANFGITDPNAAARPEIFKKVVSDILTGQIRALAQSGVGRVLMSEVQNLRDGIATIQNTPVSNRAQLEILSRVLKLQSTLGQMARDYKGGNLDAGFDTQVSKFLKANPLFTKDELAHPEILGAPQMRAGIDKRGDEKTVWGLRRGDPYRTPNGTLMQVE